MSRDKLLSIAVLCLLLINAATLSFVFISMRSVAQQNERPPHGEGPKRIIIARLGFDENQQQEYELIIDEHRSQMHRLRQESQQLHNALYSLLKEKSIRRNEADSLIEAIALNQKTTDNVNFDHFQKIKAICREDQLQKFDALAGELARLFGGPPH